MICLGKSLGFWLLELIYKQVDPDLGGNQLLIFLFTFLNVFGRGAADIAFPRKERKKQTMRREEKRFRYPDLGGNHLRIHADPDPKHYMEVSKEFRPGRFDPVNVLRYIKNLRASITHLFAV